MNGGQAGHGLEAAGRVGGQTWTALTGQPPVGPADPGPVRRQRPVSPEDTPAITEIVLPA